jgi:hypothetical protein
LSYDTADVLKLGVSPQILFAEYYSGDQIKDDDVGGA